MVSLKDGMFNNANVLYKTKFVDGVSTVTRYEQFQNRKNAGALKKTHEVPKREKRQSAETATILNDLSSVLAAASVPPACI